jgi:type IV pilus assembly protein PilE
MKKFFGFTLMELLTVVVIVGILAAIAFPSYNSYIYRSRRTDGKVALMNLANYMESYYSENNTYATATLTIGASVGTLGVSNTSPEGYYTLTIPTQTATAYTLTATPTGAQAGDTTCTTLTLTNTNVKGATPAGNEATCWN